MCYNYIIQCDCIIFHVLGSHGWHFESNFGDNERRKSLFGGYIGTNTNRWIKLNYRQLCKHVATKEKESWWNTWVDDGVKIPFLKKWW